MLGGAKLEARAVTLTGPDTLVLDFAASLPADARLYYGYGYGRLAGEDGSGHGHAVYDDQGMPIWADARGLAADGVIHAPVAASATLQGGDGADQWVVAPGAGGATIVGFTPGVDHLIFTGIPAGSLAVTPAAEGGLVIVFDAAGHNLALPGVSALAPGDILFA